MLFGLAIGLVVAFGVYVNERRPATDGAGPAAAARDSAGSEPGAGEPPHTATAGGAATETEPDDRFGFYELLPRYEVVVPELETPAPAPNRTVAVGEPGTYVLQAGSFATETDAERQRARLGLLGIESRIQRVVVDDREFHRVRVGPLSDLDALNSIRRQLLDAQIESLLMRMN